MIHGIDMEFNADYEYKFSTKKYRFQVIILWEKNIYFLKTR